MTKREFLEQLAGKLPPNEREERLAFYSEMIDDRMEEGLTEEEAVASIDVAEENIPEEKPKSKRRLTAGEITLLVLGSPIWLSLLIAAFAVAFSLYASLWVILISLWAVFGSMVACGVCLSLAGVGFAAGVNVPSGLAMLGCGFVCGGLSIFCFYGCQWATKATVHLTKKLMAWIFRKEKAQ